MPTFYYREMKFFLKKGIITNVWLRLNKKENQHLKKSKTKTTNKNHLDNE